MLKRIGSQLYWAARHIERAEWRARLVNVNYHLLLEAPPRDEEPWEPLLAITGEGKLFAASYLRADEASVVGFFTFDLANPSSIRGCILQARTSLAGLRHRISSELWLELNSLYLDSQEWSLTGLSGAGVFDFYADLFARFYRVAGIIQDTLARDFTYDFWQIGRMLERADNVARLLDVKYHYLLPSLDEVGGPIDQMQWAAVLRSASALEAFRRHHGNAIQVERVVEMLLFDPSFPRSVRFCTDQLEPALARIAGAAPPLEGNHGAPELGPLLLGLRQDNARAVIKRGLHEFLLQLEEECARTGSLVFDRYLSLD